MKSLLTVLCLISALGTIHGQSSGTLTIEESYRVGNRTLSHDQATGLIASSEEYSISNAAKGFLPVITIHGQDSYQSGVTNFLQSTCPNSRLNSSANISIGFMETFP